MCVRYQQLSDLYTKDCRNVTYKMTFHAQIIGILLTDYACLKSTTARGLM